jgi:hypothetical protein
MLVWRALVAVFGLGLISACSGLGNFVSSGQSGDDGLLTRRATLVGTVLSAAGPIADADVTLYLAGSRAPRLGARKLGHTTTRSNGSFTIHYVAPAQGVVYAVATNGSVAGNPANSAIGLMGIAGWRGTYASRLAINEFSTVADEFALAQFVDETGANAGASASNRAGIENAAMLALTNLADPATGNPAGFWPPSAKCSGGKSQPANCEGLERLNSLANALASCTASKGPSSSNCKSLFKLTRSRGTTLAAVHALVLNPAGNVGEIFDLSQNSHVYEPAAGAAPSAWFLAIKYVGNGREFDGPGAMAIDAMGNVWVDNNYQFKVDHSKPTCGGKQVLELTPVGTDVPGAPFNGGGTDGAGWGITLDLKGNVWVANFGFAGKGCKNPPNANSVTELDAFGHPLSPSSGFTPGPIASPQAATIDQRNNLWIANFGNGSIAEYPRTNPNAAKYFSRLGLTHPFAIAVDAGGNLWITDFGNDQVVAIAPNGKPLPNSPYTRGGLKRPLGDAFDSRGDLWISNSLGNSVTALDATGRPIFSKPLTGGGVRLPWGIAVDGNDNVWVADFSGSKPRVSELCGVARQNCPAGSRAGSPISPDAGFASGLLQRLTGVSVDASGNVWLCDNWLPVPVQTNPGGDSLVEVVGLAGPVKTPMVGPPQQP